MVTRLFVERKPGFAQEAESVETELREVLGLCRVEGVRLLNRYDVEGLEPALLEHCKIAVFSEPQTDTVTTTLPKGEDWALAVEYVPGQYDQRADAAEQCIQLISQGERPTVRTARVYLIAGSLTEEDRALIKKFLINPVECREAGLNPVKTLKTDYPEPEMPAVLTGFRSLDAQGRSSLMAQYGLAMDEADLALCQSHFSEEGRDPSVTELRVLDTYWSDHCRHTTFHTELTDIVFDDPAAKEAFERYLSIRRELGVKKPITLMDMGTIAARYFKRAGKLAKLDDSPEINACTVKITVEVNGKPEPWLLLFKNETHNHPTEIEPFGGAATCLGGAIRDPLSGRAYVYQAMRLTGAADPRKGPEETLPGKLSQRKIVTSAAAGYSSYGNQIGLSTGLVDEVYHEGYAAKRMEIGAVVGAAPAQNVRREVPSPGDVVLLLGGKTGRDGCGGATGSSKAHTLSSLETCGAEVQKGNAPEERKLQRLFRNRDAARLIKRCNDFGAGGVSVAIGELADGLDINLDAVPRKYAGLDGTELAISESQERMAVVVAPQDEAGFMALAQSENLLATRVAVVTQEPRLVMRLKGQIIVDLSRAFIDTNGASRAMGVRVEGPKPAAEKENRETGFEQKPEGFDKKYLSVLADLNVCSKRGLLERFDSTIGAGTVLMPLGGSRQRTPAQAMAAKLPVLDGETDACSVMAWGFDPGVSEASPYRGAYLAVAESLAKLAATGAPLEDCYLSFQEYFPKPGKTPERWGLPTSALLGALSAQLDFGVAAIGGKDSMSGTFEKLNVPPTLVSFAITLGKAGELITPEFKKAGSPVVLLKPEYDANGLPKAESFHKLAETIRRLALEGRIRSVYTPGKGGVAAAAFKMAVGNGLGFHFEDAVSMETLFGETRCMFLAELAEQENMGELMGYTQAEQAFAWRGHSITLGEMERAYDGALEGVYPTKAKMDAPKSPVLFYEAKAAIRPRASAARPKVLIPVFPGTNCEYDSARAVEKAGGQAKIMVINTMTAAQIRASAETFANELRSAQVLFLPGGFSGGDEPDGSGKFITAFLRNPAIAQEIDALLNQRDGLALGICNGFQALVKLGLVPFGKMTLPDASAPTLTFNAIGRHQSRLVRTKIVSNQSPWFLKANRETIYTVPISHGEGRFLCDEITLQALADNGQIATQYVNEGGRPAANIDDNPACSLWAIEGITSPDGRVLGKMGHSERIGANLYRNVPGEFDMKLFESAVEYFK